MTLFPWLQHRPIRVNDLVWARVGNIQALWRVWDVSGDGWVFLARDMQSCMDGSMMTMTHWLPLDKVVR